MPIVRPVSALLAQVIDARGYERETIEATIERWPATDGTVVAERRDPRHSFAGHQMSTPWDELQRAYCNGEALWTYPTTLFLLALEGVVVEEMSPGAGATKRGACCTHFL